MRQKINKENALDYQVERKSVNGFGKLGITSRLTKFLRASIVQSPDEIGCDKFYYDAIQRKRCRRAAQPSRFLVFYY